MTCFSSADESAHYGFSVCMLLDQYRSQLRWEQDGQLVLEMNERAPLPLEGHDRFGFSSWQNDTYFDNLKITPL